MSWARTLAMLRAMVGAASRAVQTTLTPMGASPVWTVDALILAEEPGVGQAVAAAPQAVAAPPARRLLGLEADPGAAIGLESGWARRALVATGHYGEVYDRHLGPLDLPRGHNALARDGGLLYALPLR